MAGDNIAAAIDALRSDLIVRIEQRGAEPTAKIQQQESTSRAQQSMVCALIGILVPAVFGILASMFPRP